MESPANPPPGDRPQGVDPSGPGPQGPAPWGALLWSLVCPGIGEWRTGHRTLGLGLIVVFAVACVWLLVTAYGSVYALSVAVKTQDPTLAAPPATPSEATTLAVRLAIAIHREYLAKRDEIHRACAGPLAAVLILYVFSMGQAFVLARRARNGPPTVRS